MPGQFRTRGSLRKMGHGFRFGNTMFGLEIFKRPRKGSPKARNWTRISAPPIVFGGDFENRSPEANVGLPKIENSPFRVFVNFFAQVIFLSGSVCENCRGDFCARVVQVSF